MNYFTPLETLFAAPRDAALPVFLSPQQQITDWQTWLSHIGQWRELFQQQPAQRWALFHPCAAEFSACLFALLSLGKTVYLPGNRQPEVVKRLSALVDGFAGEWEAHQPTLNRSSSPSNTSAEALAELRSLRLDMLTPLIQVFTSGSSGEPQAIPKNLRQLSDEVSHLYSLWGRDCPNALMLGTVSHQHIYGLLFRVLLPLSAGWCTDTHPCEYIEELALRHLPLECSAAPDQSPPRPRLLASSPTHLSRIPATLEPAVTRDLHGIFSSGAPLLRASSLQARNRLGVGVREVFGSSETGGIAWREQSSPTADAPWQPLPGVQVRLSNSGDTIEETPSEESRCLEVRSAHMLDPCSWYRTSDRVKFNDQGHFSLLGRADRIVKVEGKRVSLDEMEKHLQQHPWVALTSALLLDAESEHTKPRGRTEMAAVVVLSETGQQALASQGKHAINLHFREHLLSYFERPTLPRKWRYVDRLPLNSQGKLQRQALVSLFHKTENLTAESHKAASPQLSSRPTLPTVLSVTPNEPGGQRLQLHIPADLLYFDGHFEQAAILPGVVQIHWAEHFARHYFEVQGEFSSMEVIKFQKVVTPESQVVLDLAYDTRKHKITFAYHSPAAQHSSGRIVLSGPVMSGSL